MKLATILIRISIAAVAAAAALLWNGQLPLNSQSQLVSSAEAIIGRPLTPLSYAGVARRTTRRAVVGGAVYGGAVYGAAVVVAPPVVVAPSCVQAVDPYGRIYTRCY